MRRSIAVLSAYFPLFEEQMPKDFKQRQVEFADHLCGVLAEHFRVAYASGLISSEEEGRQANAQITQAGVDVVVFASTMAAPASYGWAALDGLSVPVVLWVSPRESSLSADLDQAEAHEDTTMLGALMLANVLVRHGLPFRAVTAALWDDAAMQLLRRTVRGFAAGARLRGRTALLIGDPYPGYLNVQADETAYHALGVRCQSVEIDELNATYAAVSEPDLERARSRVTANNWTGQPEERALRLAATLDALVDRHDAVCGSINCHGPGVRTNRCIGIPACLGVSLATSNGVPFSCTGDLPAAVALTIGRALAGAVLYSEFYTPELATGTLLLANGGEGDVGLAKAAVQVVPSTHYPGVCGPGAALAFELPTGPATIMSLAYVADGWRLVWALGEARESRYPRMQAPNTMFAFESTDALDRWIESGATHHNAFVPGHWEVELPLAAAAVGADSWQV
jgi:L-arabinose isomerase